MMGVQKGRKPAALFLNVLAVLSLAVLVYLAWHTDFRQIGLHLAALPRGLVLFLLALQVVTQLALNYQWFRLCRTLGLQASFGELLLVNAYGTVVDAANPGEKVGGEVARVLQLHSLLGFSANQAASLVAIQKSLSLAALVILSGLAVLVLGDSLPPLASPGLRLVVLAVLAALAAIVAWVLLGTERLNSRVQRLKSEGKPAVWPKRWMAGLARDTAAIGRRPGEWGLQLLLSLGIWTLFPLKLWLLTAQHASLNPLFLFAATFAAYFAAMIPLLPGGLGTFEAVMGGMLVASGLTWEEALAISLVFRFVTFWFVVLGSALLIAGGKMIQLTRERVHER